MGIALLSPTGAAAFETVMVGTTEATRIVIAPPKNPLAKSIREGLREAIAQAPADSRARTDARQLYYFYGSRHFEPLWLTQADDGALAFSEAAQGVIAVFERARYEGLDPADYLTEALDLDPAAEDAEALAALEGEFSAAMVRYAQDASSGRLDPRQVSSNMDVPVRRIDEAQLLETLSAAADPAAILESHHPDHPEFLRLRTLLAAHYDGEIEEAVTIGSGPLLRAGMNDPRVPDLRERLGVAAGGDAAPALYDTALADAVKDFQREMGLSVDGVVGPATIEALNGADGASAAQIVVNMERWRWMPEDLGEFNVFVNIPQYHLEVNKQGRTIWDTRVIVGTAQRQTPVFSDQIRHVVTNPYWNIPPTILREDVMPQMVINPGYISSQNMEVLYDGRVIDHYRVDWSQVSPTQIRVRQRPGRANALGQVKFLFPNRHHVYLHDTNAPGLFARSMRAISSGCVRVEHPFEFAEALLQLEPSLTVASLENSLGPSERWFNMDHRVPVHLAYFTLRADGSDTVRAYGDIYGHDARMIEMLGLD